jgi:hypothetical protein
LEKNAFLQTLTHVIKTAAIPNQELFQVTTGNECVFSVNSCGLFPSALANFNALRRAEHDKVYPDILYTNSWKQLGILYYKAIIPSPLNTITIAAAANNDDDGDNNNKHATFYQCQRWNRGFESISGHESFFSYT